MGTASPFCQITAPLLLAEGSTPYRQSVIFGRVVAVYFDLQRPSIWGSHSYPWLKIALHLGFADCDLTWAENGKEQRRTLRGEQVCFFGAEEAHSIRWKCEAPMIWIFVHDAYLKQIGLESVRGVTCVELVQLVRQELGIFRLADLFHEACSEQAKPVSVYVESKATLFATRLLRAQFGSPAPIPNGNGGLNPTAMRKVRDYVRAKLAAPDSRMRHRPAPASRDELSNAALAHIAGQSEHHFIRKFRERMGKTPQNYVMQCRLDKAEELILTQNYSPKEAAYAAGFCEPGHFYRRFRKRYGQSPHDLLKQSRP